MNPDARFSAVARESRATRRRSRSTQRALVAAALLSLGLAAQSCTASHDLGTPNTRQRGSREIGTTAAAARGLVITQTNVVTNLAPGPPAQLSGTIANPYPWPVYVRSISAKVTGTDRLACPPTNFTIAGSPSSVNALLAPGARTRPWSGITIDLTTTTSNQDACKNTTVHIAYTIP